MSGSIGRRGTISALLSAILLAALVPATAAAATRPITFNLELGQHCVGGRASDGVSLSLVWRDASFALKASTTIATDAAGYWSYCTAQDSTTTLGIGDRLKATVGATTHRLRIPKLGLFLDREADVFRGEAPAGSVLRLLHTYASAVGHAWEHVAKVTARPDGTWSFAPYFGVTGGDGARMRWRDGHGDKVWLTDAAPALNVTLGKSTFAGGTRPGASVQIVVRDGVTSALRATGTAVGDEEGEFAGQFRDTEGKAVALRAGDHLMAPSIASDADWTVPDIEGGANTATNVVTGRCLDAGASAREAWVFVLRRGVQRGWANVVTDQDGFFEVDFDDPEPWPFAEPANVKSGDRIRVVCLQATGDRVGARFLVP